MNLSRPRLRDDAPGIRWRHAATRHQGNAARGLNHKPTQQGDARLGGRCLPTGQDAMKAQRYELLEDYLGIATHVEGAMEGEGHRSRSLAHGLQSCHVQIAIGRQGTDHNTMRAGIASHANVIEH